MSEVCATRGACVSCEVCACGCSQGQVFTGKEVEKLGSKEKGITPMAIEEVLKSLLDDNEVMTDKIGTSNYYWAFASYERVQKQNKVDTLTRTLAAQQTRLADVTAENERLLASRPNTVCLSSRSLACAHKTLHTTSVWVPTARENGAPAAVGGAAAPACGPRRGARQVRRERPGAALCSWFAFSQISHTSTNMLTAHCSLTSRVCEPGRDTKRAMEGANRWTDNVYAIRKHCENQFGMSGSEFDQAFQVPADFDYME